MEQYLLLEQARFGDRLQVKLRVDPEVLSVRIPFLCIQPLVENAVRHGLEERDTPGTISITAVERGPDCWISVEDDGVGNEPGVIRRSLSGEPGDHVGLAICQDAFGLCGFGDQAHGHDGDVDALTYCSRESNLIARSQCDLLAGRYAPAGHIDPVGAQPIEALLDRPQDPTA